MASNDLEPRHLETLDRDLGRLSNLEVATAFVGRPMVGPGIAFVFIVIAGLVAAIAFGQTNNTMIVPAQLGDVSRGHANSPKLVASVPMIITQPSTITNNMILNGSEMMSGDNIIMPMDISTLATTMSMTRNGMNSMKPI